MFEKAIVDQNPHWDGELYDSGVQRNVLETLEEYLDTRQIIAITGVRRCGKSTLLRQILNYIVRERNISPVDILFLNLENPYFTPFRKDVRNLERIFEDYLSLVNPKGKIFVFLDELQYFSDWQVFVKSKYETGNIKFIVTGSNSRLLSSDLITLLSGRVFPVVLYPFNFREYLLAKGMKIVSKHGVIRYRNRLRKLCDEYLSEGGFPEVVLTEKKRLKKEILAGYAKSILYQDIMPRFELKKPYEIENLFFYLISNIGGLFTFNKLAGLVELSDKTVKDYLKYFNDAYLLDMLERYDFSVKKQIKSARKIYCVDHGLAASVSFSFSENVGHYLENAIFSEFARSSKKVYYYRTKNGFEVDFYCPDAIDAERLIQVCADVRSEKTSEREIRAIIHASDELNLPGGIIVTIDEEDDIKEKGKFIKMIPIWKYLIEKKENNIQ